MEEVLYVLCYINVQFVENSYPEALPLSKLRLEDAYPFYATGIENFEPLFVNNVFNGDSYELHMVWATLPTCASTQGIVPDIVPFNNLESFIESLHPFISRSGEIIHHTSSQTQSFVNNLSISWHANLPLSLWHGEFYERLVKSTKELLRKELKNIV